MTHKRIVEIENGIFVTQNKDEKYFFIKDGKIQSIEVPTTTELGGPTSKVVFFDNFRNEEGNKYYFDVYLKEVGWISIYKEGQHILKYEPQPDIKQPCLFHIFSHVNWNTKERKYHW